MQTYDLVSSADITHQTKPIVDDLGFLVIRNFFDTQDLVPLWEDLHRLASAFCQGLCIDVETVDPSESDRLIVNIINHRPQLQPVLYDRLQNVPSLLAIPSHPKVRRLAQHLLGTDRYGIWPRMQIRMDRYEDRRNLIEWHHDYLYNQGTKHSYTLWMPLVNFENAMGVLLIAKRSHKLGNVNFIKTQGPNRFDYTLSKEVVAGLDIVSPDCYRAGDLVVFHSLVLHSGTINTLAHRARLTALFRIQDLSTLEAFVE